MGLNATAEPGQYPEHEKLSAISELSQAIGEFLEWCQGKGWVLAEIPDEYDFTWFPISYSTNTLLARHFGIDLDRLEAEKKQMLDAIRA